MKAFVFLAEGFEETEAVVILDMLKRGGVEVIAVSITGQPVVTGAHGIPVVADQLFEAADFSGGVLLVLPGGMPGAKHLSEHKGLNALLLQYHKEGKRIAAICAAPFVLGGLDLLNGKRATVYPGFEAGLKNAIHVDAPVVKDGTVITAKGPGSVFAFGLTLLTELTGKEKAGQIAADMLIEED
ncbi:MAG: DJ-1/PfpI family protein [Dysgonamonadaceae bacterium]|jgi:4-methyl-5(b-hydroxyethyl)-thiazole monophosphate biosynthesis|nr:DJ-1/PfpI family protein [Dysgonamonadaceae bacterium]